MGTLSVTEDRPGSASADAALDRPAPPLSPWRPMRGSLMEGRTLELRDLGAGEAEAGGAKTIADDEMRTAYAAGFCTWRAGQGGGAPRCATAFAGGMQASSGRSLPMVPPLMLALLCRCSRQFQRLVSWKGFAGGSGGFTEGMARRCGRGLRPRAGELFGPSGRGWGTQGASAGYSTPFRR